MTGSIRRSSGDNISKLKMLAQDYPATTIAMDLAEAPQRLR
jgi:hypothetical protein